jgi:hypothetical protein
MHADALRSNREWGIGYWGQSKTKPRPKEKREVSYKHILAAPIRMGTQPGAAAFQLGWVENKKSFRILKSSYQN